MDPHNIHRSHRLRMKQNFIKNSGKDMYPHQLLEILLFFTIPRADTNPAAHRLLEHFGSLRNIMNAPAAELEKVTGIGPASARFISAVAELCRRYQSGSEANRKLSSADDLKEYFISDYSASPDDQLLVVSVGSQLEIIRCEYVSLAALGENTAFTARYIAEIILKCSSERIAAGIFHTSQPAIPSDSDYLLTKTIAETAQLLGTELIDMIIFNKNDAFSMRETGAFGFSQVQYHE